MDACVEPGGLTAERYGELRPCGCPAAVKSYRAGVARDAENVLLGEWHRALAAGAADGFWISCARTWTEHAQAIEEARSPVQPESSTAEQVIDSAEARSGDGLATPRTAISARSAASRWWPGLFGGRPGSAISARSSNTPTPIISGSSIRAIMCCRRAQPGQLTGSAPFNRSRCSGTEAPVVPGASLRLPTRSNRASGPGYNRWGRRPVGLAQHSGPRGGLSLARTVLMQ